MGSVTVYCVYASVAYCCDTILKCCSNSPSLGIRKAAVLLGKNYVSLPHQSIVGCYLCSPRIWVLSSWFCWPRQKFLVGKIFHDKIIENNLFEHLSGLTLFSEGSCLTRNPQKFYIIVACLHLGNVAVVGHCWAGTATSPLSWRYACRHMFFFCQIELKPWEKH